jgi:hypothetical protein
MISRLCVCLRIRYVLMENLSKHEVAQNVLEYFVNHKVQTRASSLSS